MAKSGGPTVGLDIGSSLIKVAELVPGRNGVTLRALGIAPTPPGAMENNIIVDAQLLGQAVALCDRCWTAGVVAKDVGELLAEGGVTPGVDERLFQHGRFEEHPEHGRALR